MARHVHEDTLMVKQVLTAAGILVLSWAAFAQGIVTPYVSTPPNLPAGFAGTSYSQTLIAGPPGNSFTLSLTAGSLPAGLSLSSAGVISGVPTASGTSIFVISVSTPILGTGSETFTLTIFPGSPHLVITPAALPSADPADYGYLLNLAVGGGPPPTHGRSLPARCRAASLFANTGPAPSQRLQPGSVHPRQPPQ